MGDGRRNNGGHSTKGKAGRKPKAEEQKLIERLTPLQPKAYKALENGLDKNQNWAVKLYFEYMYGRPKQSVDMTTNGENISTPFLSVNPLREEE